MESAELVPFQPEAQRQVARSWGALVAGCRPGWALAEARGLRSLVRQSWGRSVSASVRPDLPSAPVVLDPDQVRLTSERSDWFDLASGVLAQQQHSFSGAGHILTLFDHEARMLSCDGDPAALEGLAQINFRPGGLWAEDVVGTNGPGTALATGRPTHIVGAEHFCERWHRWHCAAVPVHDPATARMAGVLDISGFREDAHPHTLNLALALVVAIEQTLTAREVQRRYLLLEAFTGLTARYPCDAVVAIDRGGRVVGSRPSLAPSAADSLALLVRQTQTDSLPQTTVPIAIGGPPHGIWFPVLDGRFVIGGCLLLEGGAPGTGSEGIPFQPGDIPVYARRLFQAAARDLGLLEVEVEPEVYAALQAYHWPGNVRELKNVIRRLVIVAGRHIRIGDLPQPIREAFAGSMTAPSSAIDEEDARLMRVVEGSRTMAEAAGKLGITRSTLYRRLERFGLRPRRVIGRE